MAPRYGIQFYPCGQIYYFTSPDTPLTLGTPVVVDTGHGENLGAVIKIVGGEPHLRKGHGQDPEITAEAPQTVAADGPEADVSGGADMPQETGAPEVVAMQDLPVYLAEPVDDRAADVVAASGSSGSAGHGNAGAGSEDSGNLADDNSDANGESDGPELSEVLSQALDPDSPNLQPIKRVAGPRDIERAEQNLAYADKARKYCMESAGQHRLDMKLVHTDVSLDGGKLIFFFTAPGRIDFRELVKVLARNFHARIELRQIGVRHETQLVGAIGNCGMVCCCRRYMRKFAPVTIKMAKEQGLFLNPVKISGTCGRLLCCLAFEQHNYEEFHGRCPKLGKKYETDQGVFKVLRASLFRNSLSLLPEVGDEMEVTLEEWQAMNPVRFDASRRQKAEKEARLAAKASEGSEGEAACGETSAESAEAGSKKQGPVPEARAGEKPERREESGERRGRARRGGRDNRRDEHEPRESRAPQGDRDARPEPANNLEVRPLQEQPANMFATADPAAANNEPPAQKDQGAPKFNSGLSRFLAAASGGEED